MTRKDKRATRMDDEDYKDMIKSKLAEAKQNPVYLARLNLILVGCSFAQLEKIYGAVEQFAKLALEFNRPGSDKYKVSKLLSKPMVRYHNLTGMYLYKPPIVKEQ